MPFKFISKRTLLITALSVFSVLLFDFIVIQNIDFSVEKKTVEIPPPIILDPSILVKSGPSILGLPVRLTIPKIKVDTMLKGVGITPLGAVGAPESPRDAAWFDLSPRPGEIGSSIIVGHYGWKNGIGSVFDDLYLLQKEDELTVLDEEGVLTTFVVREIRSFDEKSDVSTVFGSSDGKAHLNLITCEGKWDPVSKSYSKRLVVFTDKK